MQPANAQDDLPEIADDPNQGPREETPPWRYVPRPGEKLPEYEPDQPADNDQGLEGGLTEIPPVAEMTFTSEGMPTSVGQAEPEGQDFLASITPLVEKAQTCLGYYYGGKLGQHKDQAVSAQLTGGILEMALGLLAACRERGASPQQISQRARQGGPLVQIIVRRHVRQALTQAHGNGGWRQHNGEAITQALLQAGREADPAELQQLAIVSADI